MKKFISILTLFICLFSLTSCFNGGVSKPKTGRRVREITLTRLNNEIVTINKKTDPIIVYQTIEELYKNEFCFEYYGSYKIKEDDMPSDRCKGLVVHHDNLLYFTTINKFKKINNYFYVENKYSSDEFNYYYINLYTLKDQPLYGIADDNKFRYAFINNGEEVRGTFPSYADMTEKDSKKICDYLQYGDNVQQLSTKEGLLGGLYNENLCEKFEYKFTLTKNYIIFKVKQPYGFPESDLPTEAIKPNGKFVKEIYFNIKTFQIDYVKTKANIYHNLFKPNLQMKYFYVLSRVDLDLVNSDIEKLKQYTKENTVLSSNNY